MKTLTSILSVALVIATATSSLAASYTWNGGTGDWSVAGNWTPGSGPPGASDTATVNSGTVTVSADTSVHTLNLGGGTVDGTAILTVTNTLNWTSGFMVGSGTTRLLAGSAGLLSGGGAKQMDFGRRLENGGTVVWDDGVIVFGGSGPVTWVNLAGGVLDIRGSDLEAQRCAIEGVIENDGTIRRSAGSGTVLLGGAPCQPGGSYAVINRGLIEVQTGTLLLGTDGATAQSTGNFVVAAGATLRFRGTGTQNLGGTMSIAGTLSVIGSAVNVTNDLLAPSVSVSGGSLNVQGQSVFGSATLSGGTLNCTGVGTMTNLTLNGGTLSGTNLVSVVSNLTWTSGFMVGSGTTRLLAGSAGLLSGGGAKQMDFGRRLENGGTVVWDDGVIRFGGSGPVTWANLAEGVLDIRGSDLEAQRCAIQGVIENDGTIRRSAGSGTVLLGGSPCQPDGSYVVHNRGLVEVQTGTLVLGADGATAESTGNFSVSAGATLRFRGTGTQNLSGTMSIAGTLSVIGSAVNVTNDLLAPNLSVSGGSLNVQGQSVFGSATLSGGTLNCTGVGTVTNLTLNGGTLSGTNLVSVMSNLTWTSGFMVGSGTTRLLAGSAGLLSGGEKHMDFERRLENGGTVVWDDGVIVFGGSGPVTWANLAGGVLDIRGSDLAAQRCAILGVIENDGTIRRSAGSGTVLLGGAPCQPGGSYAVNNRGLIEVQSGTLRFEGSFTQTAGALHLSGGNVSANSTLQIQGGSLSGTGMITASVTSSGSVMPGTSPGLLTINGDYVQTASGLLNIDLAGTSPGTNFDKLAVTGTATIAGTLNVALTNGFYPATNAMFTYLTAATVSGTFATFNYPTNDVGMQVNYTTTNSTIQVINVRPVIPVISGQTVDELVLYSLAVNATDDDFPPQTLTYALTNSPANANIDSSGQITWTANEAEGPVTTNFTVRVTDNPAGAGPNLTVSRTFAVVVNEINVAPNLTLPSDQIINEQTVLSLTATATDFDLPTNALKFELVSGPAGMTVSTNGAINWMPDESQGSNSYTVKIRVTDTNQFAVNAKELSTTNMFTLTVNEVNLPPSLTVPGNQTLTEETPLAVSASATDPDLPANGKMFSLVSPPMGMMIDAGTGAITWTPDETQGSNSYTIKVVVKDDSPFAVNDKQISITNEFTVTVNESNRPPVLTLPADQMLDEQTPLSVIATATDPDFPANSLTFELVSGPSGLMVSTAGAIDWIPGEDQGPNSYTVKVKVTDNSPFAVNAKQISITNEFMVTVNESNRPPVLGALANFTKNAGETISFTATATDPDLPANGLSYSLLSPPAGATIDSGSGLFHWRVKAVQADTTNVVRVRVMDDGAPNKSGTNTFTVIVNPIAPVTLTPVSYSGGQFTMSITGPIGPDYIIQGSTNLIDWTNLDTNTPASVPFNYTDTNAGTFAHRFYRALLDP